MLPSPIEIGGLEIDAEIGRGAHSTVYRARRGPQEVALKVYSGQADDPSVLRRFRSEGAALARLRHDALPRVLEIGTYQGRPYLVMQYGLDVLKQIRASYEKLPVLILSMHGEAEYAVRAFRAGAAGYLTKRSARKELAEAIRRISQGRKYVTPAVAEQLVMDGGRGGDEPGLDLLSDREFQVLALIASGMRIKDIAAQLGISAKTISTHRTNLLEKLGLHTTAELIRFALSRGIG